MHHDRGMSESKMSESLHTLDSKMKEMQSEKSIVCSVGTRPQAQLCMPNCSRRVDAAWLVKTHVFIPAKETDKKHLIETLRGAVSKQAVEILS
jgi:hypothetical protein